MLYFKEISVPGQDIKSSYMARHSSNNEEITEADIFDLGIKDLNKKLKQQNVPKVKSTEIRKQRRRHKMDKYRKTHLIRKGNVTNLTKKRDLLRVEFRDIKQEVNNLRIKRELLYELTRVDDSKYGRLVIVD